MDNGHDVDMNGNGDADNEFIEQKIINEEYKIWKKNSVWLYDMMYARALTWPTLTTQWLPDKKSLPNNMNQYRILYGTNTNEDQQNFIEIASLEVPDLKAPDPAQYNDQTGEIGGHGSASKPFDFKVIQKINHPGEVNKARYQPQNPNIIATMAIDGRSLIFDRTKHPTKPKNENEVVFELQLEGHEEEGFGLDWSPLNEGQLATGASDNTVRVWYALVAKCSEPSC